jgi:hypothetical protein
VDSTKQRDNGERTGAKTASGSSSAGDPMDGTTPAQTNGLQEYFALCDANVDTEAQRCACPVGNSTQGRRLEPNNITDETCYQLFRNTIRRWSKNPRAEVKRIPKNRQKIMVWGGFSVKGLVGYHSFKCIMDGPYYVQILQDHLIRNARRQFSQSWRLQQDNDPKHRSGVAKQFLHNEVPEMIDWPSNSPDVNPVENLWSIIKRRVEKRKPSNLDELDRFLHEEWDTTDLATLNHLVKSMKARCLALIDSKGERINY